MNNYLFIQKILWDNRLTVELVTTPNIESRLVPVFILQPLVENSIKHGLDNRSYGHIQIEIKETGTGLSLKIQDDGQGIPPVSLQLLQEWLSEDENELQFDTIEHIGIRNIYNRIRLLYGKKSSFTIENAPQGGTIIQIILPDKDKENDNV